MPNLEAVIKHAVNISPLALMRDGRSLRYAWTLYNAGWKVTVVEGMPSRGSTSRLPFDVIPFIRKKNKKEVNIATKKRMFYCQFSEIRELLSFVYFAFYVFIAWPIVAIFKIPSAELYILHEYRYFPAIFFRAKLCGAKIIYDAHDFYPLVHSAGDLTRFWHRCFRPFLYRLERACVSRVDAMITVNSGIAELYRRTFGIQAKVLRNVHDKKTEVPIEQNLRQKLGLKEDTYLLVVIGNRKPGQNVTIALKSLQQMPEDVVIAFVGRGYAPVVEEAKAMGLSDRVYATGPIDNPQMVPFVSGADAALILYYARSGNDVHFLPNGFFQGIAAGLPVLYPNLRWIREIAEPRGIGICIDPNDANSIANNVHILREKMNEPALTASLKKAKDEFTWENEAVLLLAEINILQQINT